MNGPSFLNYLPGWLPFIDLLKAYAWPLVFVVCALVFKKQIKELGARLMEISPTGAKFGTKIQENIPSISASNIEGLRDLKGAERTPAVSSLELRLHEAFKSVESSERFDRALRELAISRLDTSFALTYGNIFGSQIELLKRLRNSSDGMTKYDVVEYFKALGEKFDIHAERNVDEYLSFLLSNGLIVRDSDGRIKVSDAGADFLLFLYRYNLPEFRAF